MSKNLGTHVFCCVLFVLVLTRESETKQNNHPSVRTCTCGEVRVCVKKRARRTV